MAVAADAQQLHVDAAGGFDGSVVTLGFGNQVFGIAVGQVGFLHVDVVKQLGLHEGVVAGFVFDVQTHVFVQVVADAFGEVQNAFLVPGDQLLVAADGGRTGGKAQNGVGLAGDLRSEEQRGGLADLLGIFKNTNLHGDAPPVSYM